MDMYLVQEFIDSMRGFAHIAVIVSIIGYETGLAPSSDQIYRYEFPSYVANEGF